MSVLRVIAAAVVSARGLLLISKRVSPGVFFLPGGKPEPGETPLACLRREILEELAVEVATATPLLEVRAPAVLEGVPMHMSVFSATLQGNPRPCAEIADLAWWPERHGLELAPAVRDYVIPRLERTAGIEPGNTTSSASRTGPHRCGAPRKLCDFSIWAEQAGETWNHRGSL